MKSFFTHKLHTNVPNTSNELVHKAIIIAPAQKDAWVVQFTIKSQSAIIQFCNLQLERKCLALPCQTPTRQFQL